MSNRFRLLGVKNAELLAGLSQLVKRGNELTAEVLAHLAELEERRLHLQLGFASLFAYCVEAHGLSEGAAGHRVAAARVCRRFPEAFELVARGDLHLSALCGLAPHLSQQNATELFTACCRKTRRQVDELIAARFPKPDVRELIRRLPVSGRALAMARDLRIPAPTETCEETKAKANAGSQGHHPTALETAAIVDNCGSERAAASAADIPGMLRMMDTERPTVPARHREVEALSADRFGVHFTADAELRWLIERARALASYRLPKNDLPSLMRMALESFVKQEEARRFGVGRKPRRPRADAAHTKAARPRATPPGEALPIEGLSAGALPIEVPSEGALPGEGPSAGALPGEGPSAGALPGEGPSAIMAMIGKTSPIGSPTSQVAAGSAKRGKLRRRSRCVCAAVRRAVYLRDGARCTFVSEDGRRCGASAMLELDHVKPWAKLGGSGVDNIRLRCRAHNQLHARACFGAAQVEAKIVGRRRATVATA